MVGLETAGKHWKKIEVEILQKQKLSTENFSGKRNYQKIPSFFQFSLNYPQLEYPLLSTISSACFFTAVIND